MSQLSCQGSRLIGDISQESPQIRQAKAFLRQRTSTRRSQQWFHFEDQQSSYFSLESTSFTNNIPAMSTHLCDLKGLMVCKNNHCWSTIQVFIHYLYLFMGSIGLYQVFKNGMQWTNYLVFLWPALRPARLPARSCAKMAAQEAWGADQRRKPNRHSGYGFHEW